LMRCPVLRLSWLKEIFSPSEVAGYSATGQVTRESRRKPFQLARGAINAILQMGSVDSRRSESSSSDRSNGVNSCLSASACSGSMQISTACVRIRRSRCRQPWRRAEMNAST
jgi:hypothetical protein